MWHGAGAPIWWNAFRVESTELRQFAGFGDVVELRPAAAEAAARKSPFN
jgi:hypothetical protein